MQHEDKDISSHSCACLANLAEISYNQEIIVAEGGIQPCVVMVRSKFLEVQREAGRLLSEGSQTYQPFIDDASAMASTLGQGFQGATRDELLGDAAKAKQELEWKPKYSFEDLVREMVEMDCD